MTVFLKIQQSDTSSINHHPDAHSDGQVKHSEEAPRGHVGDQAFQVDGGIPLARSGRPRQPLNSACGVRPPAASCIGCQVVREPSGSSKPPALGIDHPEHRIDEDDFVDVNEDRVAVAHEVLSDGESDNSPAADADDDRFFDAHETLSDGESDKGRVADADTGPAAAAGSRVAATGGSPEPGGLKLKDPGAYRPEVQWRLKVRRRAEDVHQEMREEVDTLMDKGFRRENAQCLVRGLDKLSILRQRYVERLIEVGATREEGHRTVKTAMDFDIQRNYGHLDRSQQLVFVDQVGDLRAAFGTSIRLIEDDLADRGKDGIIEKIRMVGDLLKAFVHIAELHTEGPLKFAPVSKRILLGYYPLIAKEYGMRFHYLASQQRPRFSLPANPGR
ncbi:hypothetical protein ACTPOE_08330 [Castellaniella sp. WN]